VRLRQGGERGESCNSCSPFCYGKNCASPNENNVIHVVAYHRSKIAQKFLRFTVHSIILLSRFSSLGREKFPIKHQWLSVPTGTIMLTKSPALQLLSLDNQGMAEGGLSE